MTRVGRRRPAQYDDHVRYGGDVKFILVMGDESDKTHDELVDKEKVHEEDGIMPDELVGDVLYYGDHHSAVVQLHRVNNPPDLEVLIDANQGEGAKLVVLNVGLKHCRLCVKEYPTVVKLSRSMADMVAFARMSGDENESCMEFAADMESLLGRGDDSFSMEELGFIDTPTYCAHESGVKEEVPKARQLVWSFIRSTEEVDEKVEDATEKGELTELVLMIMEEPYPNDLGYIKICLVAKEYVQRQ